MYELCAPVGIKYCYYLSVTKPKVVISGPL